MHLSRFPRLHFAHLPTPLEPMPRLMKEEHKEPNGGKEVYWAFFSNSIFSRSKRVAILIDSFPRDVALSQAPPVHFAPHFLAHFLQH